MIIYNVTINIENSVHDSWLEWMKKIHIPEVMKTGLFSEYKICRLIGDEDTGGVTYSVQYFCKTMNEYETYQDKFAGRLQAEHLEKFKEKFVAFRSLLEVLD